MTEPTTVNVGIIVPNTGDLVGTWGSAALNPDFVAIDGFFGGVQTVVASASPIVLTSPSGFTPTPSGGPTQSQNGVLRFTGTLTAGVQVTLPLPGYIIIENLTTGNFVLSFRAIGSGEVIGIGQGRVQHVYNDGTNVRFVNLPDVGTYVDIAASAVPAWITACTKPPFLNCDGSTFNATTYPYLNALLGGNTLPDSRGNVRATLNQGTGRLTNVINGSTFLALGGTDTVTLTPAQLPTGIISSVTQGITVVVPSGQVVGSEGNAVFNGVFQAAAGSSGTYVAGTNSGGWNSVGAFAGNNTITVTSNNTSGNAHSNVQPTYVGGLTLIRAA